MLESLVKVGAVAQLADHGDSVLMGQKHIGMNGVASTKHLINHIKTVVRWGRVGYIFGVTVKIKTED